MAYIIEKLCELVDFKIFLIDFKNNAILYIYV